MEILKKRPLFSVLITLSSLFQGVIFAETEPDPAIIEALQGDKLENRLAAIKIIAELESIPEAYWTLIATAALDPQDHSDIQNAARQHVIFLKASEIFSSLGKPATASIIPHLDDDKKRWRAVNLLSRIDQAALPALPNLLTAAADKDPRVRYFAAKTIVNLNQSGAPAIELLIRLLDDPDNVVQEFAILSLGEMKSDSDEIIAALGKKRRYASSENKRLATEIKQELADAKDNSGAILEIRPSFSCEHYLAKL